MADAAGEIFEDYALASLYDAFNPWGVGDDFYLALARETGGPVLDLGCGTGMLACRIAAEISPVTAVDPAAGMLQVARSRPGAERVTWIEADGRNLQLQQRFNLIYLAGHAFQVFLTDRDLLSVLRTAARHLNPEGRLAIETRNPGARAWLSWNPRDSRKVAQLPDLGRAEEFCESVYRPATGIAELTHHYRFLDKGGQQVGHSKLRFIGQDHLADLIGSAGLSPREWYGSWDRSDYSPASREIIVVAALT